MNSAELCALIPCSWPVPGFPFKPYAENEVKLLLIEPRGVLNTGHEGGPLTAENDVWI